MVALANVGLILRKGETKLLTTQAQPPKTVTTPRGVSVAVVDRAGCHKWFGCILSGNNKGSHRADREYHSQAASRAFFANKNILCNKAASFRKLWFFFWENCYSCCMLRRWPQQGLQNRSGHYECSSSPIASIWRWPTQPHKLAEPVTQRNSRPSQSYGPRGTWETTTAKHQRAKHHCRKNFSWELPVS